MPERAVPRPDAAGGYAPFNVAEIGDRVFVTYAQQDAAAWTSGRPRARVRRRVHPDGALVHRFASRGVLNSPWGMTIAPATFGAFAGDLLIGNFGDGGSTRSSRAPAHLLGTLRGTRRASRWPSTDCGGCSPGDPAAGGTDAVWFSAGPDGESHGLLGLLTANT